MAALAVQGLGVHLAKQGTPARPLIREGDPRGAQLSRSAAASEPEFQSLCVGTSEDHMPRPVLRKKSRPKEKPAHNQREEPPLTATRGSDKDPAQPKGSKERKSKCDRKLEIHTQTLPYDHNAKTETKGLV